jgi:hypothetical protein
MRLGITSTRYTAQSTRDERLSQKIGATSYGDDSAVNTTGIFSHFCTFLPSWPHQLSGDGSERNPGPE